MNIVRHFTVTTFIVFSSKTLLHLHKKLNVWLPVGGHINENELPEEAAIREAKEESGLDVEIVDDTEKLRLSKSRELINPRYMVLQDISEDHKHIDFAFFAKAKTDVLKPRKGESVKFRWVSMNELDDIDSPENCVKIAKEAIRLINN